MPSTPDETKLEVNDELFQEALNNHGFHCTTNLDEIRDCNFYVVAVSTPGDDNNCPDLKPLYGASETVGKVISKGDIVGYRTQRFKYPHLSIIKFMIMRIL